MTIYNILDRDKTPQQLPLNKLYHLILDVIKQEDGELVLLSSEGYGETICRWEDQLKNDNKIIVDKNIFEKISEGTEEWFYNVDVEIKLESNIIWFGLADSSYLYVACQKDVFSDILINSFEEIREATVLPWSELLDRSPVQTNSFSK